MQVLSSYHSVVGVSVAAARPQPSNEAAHRPSSSEPTGMQRVRSDLPIHDRPRDHGTSASATSMKYRRSERTALFIETQEGDVVRLKFKSRESVHLKAAQAQGGGASTSEMTLRARSASKLSVSVRGDLNAEELVAIQDAIERASELADGFFDGNLSAAFSSASALDIDADQLASVRLKMKSTERLTYSSYARRAPSPVPQALVDRTEPTEHAGGSDDATRSEPVSEHTVPSIAPAPPEVRTDATLDSVAPSAEDAEATEPVGPEVDAQRDARDRAFRAIGTFLTRMVDSFAGDAGRASTGRIDMSLKLRVFEATLLTISQTRADEPPLPELVHETFDALAAHEADPMVRVA